MAEHLLKKTPEMIATIEELMEYETAGDPISGLKCTRKTTEKIADELELIGNFKNPGTAVRTEESLDR